MQHLILINCSFIPTFQHVVSQFGINKLHLSIYLSITLIPSNWQYIPTTAAVLPGRSITHSNTTQQLRLQVWQDLDVVTPLEDKHEDETVPVGQSRSTQIKERCDPRSATRGVSGKLQQRRRTTMRLSQEEALRL